MKKIILCFLLLTSVNVFAQKQGSWLIDSLKTVLVSANEDTNKVILLCRLSFEYYKVDTDTGLKYAEAGLALSEKLNWDSGIANSFNVIGTNYAVKGYYPKALDYFIKSLTKYTEINDRIMIATLSNNLGLLYSSMENNVKAVEYFDKSLKINEQLKNKKGLALNYGNLGNIFTDKKEYSKAIEYHLKALKICLEFNDKEAISRHMSNIAYDKLKLKDYCEAFNYAFKSINISRKINSTYNLAMGYEVIGEAYYDLSEEKLSDLKNCQYYSANKDELLTKADENLQKSLKLFGKVNDIKSFSDVSLTLSKVNEALGDYKNAFINYKNYSEKKDTVFSNDSSIKIANIEKEREVELKDNQIKIKSLELENKNSQMLFQVVLSLVVLIMFSLLSYSFYKRQKNQKKLNIELDRKNEELQKVNATKNKFFSIIAHDLKGPFQGFMGLTAMMAEDVKLFSTSELETLCKEMHNSANSLFKLLLNLLDWAQMQKGTVAFNPTMLSLNQIVLENIETANANLKQKEINLNVSIPESINIYADEKMINAILRNLISNAIKFTNKQGSISISAKKDENGMAEIHVADTGIGMDAELCGKLFKIEEKIGRQGTGGEVSSGLGLILCKEFIEMHGGKIWVDTKEGIGTKFSFTLPVKENSIPKVELPD